MNFTCERAVLFAALSNVTRAISAHATLDILDCVMIHASGDQVTLTCTDLMMGIQAGVPADVQDEGRVCAPGKLLLEVVRRAPGDFITVTSDENNTVKTRCGGSRATLTGRSAETYPRLLMIRSDFPLTVEQATLKSMISQTSYAIAVEEARKILTGALLQTKEGELSIVALDGFRMAVRNEPVQTGSGENIHIVVPGKSMTEISRILGDEGEVTLHAMEGQLMVEMDSLLITIRLLEGEYIKYEQIIPKDYKTRVVLDKTDLEMSLERALLMAREGKNNLVKLHVSDDELQITSNSEMGDIFDEVKIVKEGPDLDIAFNVRFLIDLIKNLPSDQAEIRFGSNISPCVIQPVGAQNALFLIIPVRVF